MAKNRATLSILKVLQIPSLDNVYGAVPKIVGTIWWGACDKDYSVLIYIGVP